MVAAGPFRASSGTRVGSLRRTVAVVMSVALAATLLSVVMGAPPAQAVQTSTPVVVSGTAPAWAAAAVATSQGDASYTVSHSCAVTTTSAVKCWGYNGNGQVGIGNTTSPQAYPSTVALSASAGSSPVARTSQVDGPTVAVGQSHSCVIFDATGITGGVQCWGTNDVGQLGDGTTTDRTSPVVVKDVAGTGTLTGVVALAAGSYDAPTYGNTCAVTSDGAVYCWGHNNEGELGRGNTGGAVANKPSQVVGMGPGSGAVGVTVGYQQACAWFSDGAAKCWGANGNGQLGDNSTTLRNSPVAVSTLSDITSMSTGFLDTCAINNGAAYCWGYGAEGQIGNGSTGQVLVPTAVTGLSSGVVAIGFGSRAACATLSTGRAKCWGYNAFGEAGDGTTSVRTTPVSVLNVGEASGSSNLLSGLATGTWGSLSVGSDLACARNTSGSVMCWGLGTAGALGDGFNTNASAPVFVNGTAPTQWAGAAVSTGQARDSDVYDHSCVVTTIGGVKCWGYGFDGQMGNGSAVAANPAPLDVSLNWNEGGNPVARADTTNGNTIASTDGHTCVIVDTASVTGGLQCWGNNGYGQLGDGSTTQRKTPVIVRNAANTGPLTGVTSVATNGQDVNGIASTCAVVSGAAMCWGNNNDGRLGIAPGDTTSRSLPVQVSGLTSGVTDVALGSDFACAVHSGAAKCWGYNNAGQVGDSSTTTRNTPVQVTGLTSGVTAIAAGGWDHACAIVSGGMKCWGYNANGELGNSTTSTGATPPAQVTGLTSGVTAISAGERFSCAVITDGAVKCWGRNDTGQLGDGTTTQRTAPASVVAVSQPASGTVMTGASTGRWGTISSGGWSSCLKMTSGQVNCWGREDGYGPLGHGLAKPGGATTTYLSASVNKSATGSQVTYTATIAGIGNPGVVSMGGTVAFGGVTGTGCAAATVTSGKATCTTTTAPTNNTAVTATYSGDANWAPSNATLLQTVDAAGNTWTHGTAVSVSANCNSGTSATYALPVTATSGTAIVLGAGGGGGGTSSSASNNPGGAGGRASLTGFTLDPSTYPNVNYQVGCPGGGGQGYGAGGAGGAAGAGFGAGGAGSKATNANGSGSGGGGGGTGMCLAKAASPVTCDVSNGTVQPVPLVVAGGGGGGGGSASSGGGGLTAGGGGAGGASTGGTTGESWYSGGFTGNGVGGGTNTALSTSPTAGGGGGGVGTLRPGTGGVAAPNNTGGQAGLGGTNAGSNGTASAFGVGGAGTNGGGGGGGGFTGGGGGGGGGAGRDGAGGGGSSWGYAGNTPTLGGTLAFTTAGGAGGAGTGSVNAAGSAGTAGSVTLSVTGNGVNLTNPGAQSSPTGSAASLPVVWAAADPTMAAFTKSIDANGLPAGLSINATTGAITGTPTTPGTYNVTVTARGFNNGNVSYSRSETFTWTITGSAAGSTSSAISCVPGSVSAGNVTTCTATVTDIGPGPSVPAGTVAVTASSSALWILQSPCTLSASTSSASTCAVTVLTQQAGSVTMTATYSPSDAHLASNGSSALAVTAATGPTFYTPQSQVSGTIGDAIDVYITNCPVGGSAPRFAGTTEAHYGGTLPSPTWANLPVSNFALNANGSWEQHLVISGDTGPVDVYGMCADSVASSPSDAVVSYSFPRIAYTVNAAGGGSAARGAKGERAGTTAVEVDPEWMPLVDRVGVDLATMTTLKGRVDAIKVPTATISRLYVAFFGRYGDHGGIAYWLRQLQAGASSSRIADRFAGTPEFHRAYDGLSDAEFVDAVYTNVLGRGPDSGGRNYWLRKMAAGMGRGRVVWSFSNSSENVRRSANASYVVAAFQALTTRTPSRSEVLRLTSELDNGTVRYTAIEDVAISLAAGTWWNAEVAAGRKPVVH